MDDRCRALGREPAGRGRARHRVRARSTARDHFRDPGDLAAAHAAALDRRVSPGARHAVGDAHAASRVLVAQGSDLVAVPTAGGPLSIIKKGGASFAVREWLAADADPRSSGDPSLAQGVACDEIGCVARLADGTIVTLATAAEAYADDCRLAGLVVTSRRAPPDCAATVLDRTLRAQSGALAL